MKYVGHTGEFFEVSENNKNLIDSETIDGQLSVIWFKEDGNKLTIDSKEHTFDKDQLLFLTAFHKVEIEEIHKFQFLRFNSPFYCILDHDSEVGCKGILFFGSKNVPIIKPSDEELEILDAVWKVIAMEMKSNDNLQLEMLQMILKRILILCTRIYKAQSNFSNIDTNKVDIVRDFNFLVEQHFKDKHAVSEYASMLNKSPKTLSNLFKKLNDQTPLQMIQARRMLEVRRLLKYTDRPISEIGYEIGFSDIQSFSRFFRKHEGISPSEFRTH